MNNPNVYDTRPIKMEIEPGTYYWCQCGLSETQPFCDGSHQGTRFKPVAVDIKEKRQVAFCMCRHSNNGAFCDGSHKTLSS